MTPSAIVSKLWNYCNVLRDDGMSYGDYSFDVMFERLSNLEKL
jgi:type I restriction enzyme M protein